MTDTERVVFRVHINGPIERVWQEITRTDGLQPCFFNMRLHTPGLAPGAPFQMRTASGRYAGVVGEVLEFDPPHRYATTFRFTSLDDPPCRILYELREKDGGTEFTMTFEDLARDSKTARQMKQGGTMIVNTLKAVVETGRPSFLVRFLFVLFRALEPVTTPKACRVENWPL